MKQYYIISLLFIFVSLSGCREVDDEIIEDIETVVESTIETPDWSELSHGSTATPNYDTVFKQDDVIRIDITIDEDDWETMQDDLSSNLGSSSMGRNGLGMTTSSDDYDPIWVSCSVFYNDIEWYKVGVRYKGNSSLSSTYSSGIEKLSFKLDFDQYEDEYPVLENQRFYGFRQLNLKNNYEDESLIREKVASDLFLKFGIASPQTSFCELYVDHGNGPIYFGLYTIVEEVDDTVLDSQFSSGIGNLYKPDGDAASFKSGTYDESELVKCNNEDSTDYSDVKALYTIVNSSERTSDVEQWKTDLEAVFDVDMFLKWLAANTTMQNWDTYGNMTHNYYLYNNPENNLLTWIPWDNNEALETGKQNSSSFSQSQISSSWPLIRYLIDIPEYELQYETYLNQFINEVFIPSEMIALYEEYYELLQKSAYAETSGYSFLESDNDFDTAISTLKTHVTSRNTSVLNYLN